LAIVRKKEYRERSRRRAHVLRKSRDLSWSAVRALLLICLGFIVMYPILHMIVTSLKTYNDLVNPGVVWVPKEPTLRNYRNAIELMKFPVALRNSITVSVGTALIQTVICSLVGYGFARFRFPGREILFYLVIFTLLVPPATVVVPQYLQLRFFDPLKIFTLLGIQSLNLINKHWVFYLPAMLGMGIRSGIYIFLFRQYFRGQPRELDDSARVDGCGYFQTFLRIMAPNAASIYITAFLFALVWNWNEYFQSVILADAISTLQTSLANLRSLLEQTTQGLTAMGFSGDPYTQIACLMAGSILTISPVLALYIFMQKHFVESIERTGIVG